MLTLGKITGRWRCTRAKLRGRRWRNRLRRIHNEDANCRNPNAEIRNPKEGRNPKSEKGAEMPNARIRRNWDFGFRISAFVRAPVSSCAPALRGHARSSREPDLPGAELRAAGAGKVSRGAQERAGGLCHGGPRTAAGQYRGLGAYGAIFGAGWQTGPVRFDRVSAGAGRHEVEDGGATRRTAGVSG